MRPVFQFFAILLCCVALSGCLAMGNSPVGVSGYAYKHTLAPLLATDSTERPNKVGRSTMRSIFGLYAQGDASIQTAAQNGGIAHIHHVDVETTSILGIITDVTTIVYGN